jgi:hypothetical protein
MLIQLVKRLNEHNCCTRPIGISETPWIETHNCHIITVMGQKHLFFSQFIEVVCAVDLVDWL